MHTGQPNPHSMIVVLISGKVLLDNSNNIRMSCNKRFPKILLQMTMMHT